MRVLYGTKNKAKLESMKRITKDLGLEIIGLSDLDMPLPDINESGNDPLQNACIKAMAYYEAYKMPVFSCDSGLYFDELDDMSQPGTHVRRVCGRELTDEEMIEHYASLARKNGGKLVGSYRNAICFIWDYDHIYTSMDASLYTERFILTDKAHEMRNPGFPLDSLSVDIATGKYYYDLKTKSVDESAVDKGFRAFFENALEKIGRR